MTSEKPYSPLDKKNLGVSVADAMLMRSVEPLPPADSFQGAGIYAIYYTGPYRAYKEIATANRNDKHTAPIYVGKAVPPGARKGGFGLDLETGPALFKRLAEHAKSIEQARNIEIEDFRCRYLVVDDIWIPLGEALLIEMFSPVWNIVIDGYGNHDPGSGRYNQQLSAWDVVHPGRPWADKLQPNAKSDAEILQELKRYLEQNPPGNENRSGNSDS